MMSERGHLNQWTDILVVVVYFLFVLAVGLWVSEFVYIRYFSLIWICDLNN